MPNQINVNGVCLDKVGPGELCELTEQCQGGSSCEDGVCECPTGQKVINGKCVGITGRPTTTCPIPGQVPYVERGTQKVRFKPKVLPVI